jgi:hypothetical protein
MIEIEPGTIVYWNKERKQWRPLTARVRTDNKKIGVMTPDGSVITRGKAVTEPLTT